MGGVAVNGTRETLLAAIESGRLKPSYVQEALNKRPVRMAGYFGIHCATCEMGITFDGPEDIPGADIPCNCPGGLLLEYDYPGKPRRDVPPTVPPQPRGPQDETGRRIDRGTLDNPVSNPLSEEQQAELKAAYERARGGASFPGRAL